MNSAAGAIFGGLMNVPLTAINNMWAGQQQSEARWENYMYGEMAAEAADRRTRALYGDFYSPEALLRQYEKAGLSPSMMFGGTPGQGGMSGAQGSGANGPGAITYPASLGEAAQAAALFAQAEKTKAETKQIEPEAQSEITRNLAEAGHAKAAEAFLKAETAEKRLDIYVKDNTKDISIYTLAEMANKTANEARKAYEEMRSAKVLADVNEATVKEQIDMRKETLVNVMSATAKNKKEVDEITQNMLHQVYEWDLNWRQLDVNERQQTTYADYIAKHLPQIDKELELQAEKLGIENKRLWIDAVTETIKSIAFGAMAAASYQGGKGSNATPAGADQMLKPKARGGNAVNKGVPHYKQTPIYPE